MREPDRRNEAGLSDGWSVGKRIRARVGVGVGGRPHNPSEWKKTWKVILFPGDIKNLCSTAAFTSLSPWWARLARLASSFWSPSPQIGSECPDGISWREAGAWPLTSEMRHDPSHRADGNGTEDLQLGTSYWTYIVSTNRLVSARPVRPTGGASRSAGGANRGDYQFSDNKNHTYNWKNHFILVIL